MSICYRPQPSFGGNELTIQESDTHASLLSTLGGSFKVVGRSAPSRNSQRAPTTVGHHCFAG